MCPFAGHLREHGGQEPGVWLEYGLCLFLALVNSGHGGDNGPQSNWGLSQGTRRPLEGWPGVGIRAQNGEGVHKGEWPAGVSEPQKVWWVTRWSGRAQVGTPVCEGRWQ